MSLDMLAKFDKKELHDFLKLSFMELGIICVQLRKAGKDIGFKVK